MWFVTLQHCLSLLCMFMIKVLLYKEPLLFDHVVVGGYNKVLSVSVELFHIWQIFIENMKRNVSLRALVSEAIRSFCAVQIFQSCSFSRSLSSFTQRWTCQTISNQTEEIICGLQSECGGEDESEDGGHDLSVLFSALTFAVALSRLLFEH